MKSISSALALSLPFSWAAVVAAEGPVLDERIMQISAEAAKLSEMAYLAGADIMQYAIFEDPDAPEPVVVGYEHEDYEEIHFYTNEPDQAIVARKDGRCYISFRGTNLNLADWEQNINLNDRMIYKDNNNSTGEGCEARAGFADFLWTLEVTEGTADTFDCISRCEDALDCLVITGHSQGGATATIASILLHSANPTVVTFGQPPAVDADCPLIPSERFYRYVNSKVEPGETDDLGFDPVPSSPTFISMSVHYGYLLMLGDDTDGVGVKYLGLDQDYDFSINFMDNAPTAHFIAGYQARIESLLIENKFPVSNDGFSDGSVCERDYSVLCASGTCRENVCKSQVMELCIKGSCEEDGDCASGNCIWDSCAAGDGQVAGGCPCGRNGDCISGDCDTKFTSFDWVCEEGTPGSKTFGETTSSGSFLLMKLSSAGTAGIFMFAFFLL